MSRAGDCPDCASAPERCIVHLVLRCNMKKSQYCCAGKQQSSPTKKGPCRRQLATTSIRGGGLAAWAAKAVGLWLAAAAALWAAVVADLTGALLVAQAQGKNGVGRVHDEGLARGGLAGRRTPGVLPRRGLHALGLLLIDQALQRN